MAAEGVDVVLVARTAADLEAVRVKIVGEHNVAVRYYAIDLCDSKNVHRLAAECADIDILVNHAGAILGGNIRADRRGALAPGLRPPKAPKSLKTSRCRLPIREQNRR